MKKVSVPKVVTALEASEVRSLRRFRRRWASWWGRRGRVCSR